MKRNLITGLLILVFPIMVFASDMTEKVRVTRHNPTACSIDLGAMLDVPFSDREKGGGLFGALSITPVYVKKMSAGFRMEGAVYAGKDILDASSKIQELNFALTGTFIAKYPLAKSFEIYGGGGARYVIREVEKLTKFGQTWGFVLQGGARGRLNDRLGVGAEANFFLNIPDDETSLEILAYFSLEF